MFKKIGDGLALVLIFIAMSSMLTVCRAPSDSHETVEGIGDPAKGGNQEKTSTVKVLVPDENGEPSFWVSPAEGLCTIEGEVLDEMGRPIRNAKIHISTKDRDYSTWISVDDQGRFQVENLNHGSYELQLEFSKGHLHETRFMHWKVIPGMNRIFFHPEKTAPACSARCWIPKGSRFPVVMYMQIIQPFINAKRALGSCPPVQTRRADTPFPIFLPVPMS